MKNSLSWKIGGKAGEGIMATGLIFSQCCSRGGLYVFDINEYPSLIRGGHNTVQVRVSDREIFSQLKNIELLVALNKDTIYMHKDELSANGGIVYDASIDIEENIREDIKLYPIPFNDLIKEIGAEMIVKNNIALGASIAIFDYDLDILKGVIRDTFKRKGEKIINDNIRAAQIGFDYIKKNFPDDFDYKLEKISKQGRMLLTGNDAICIGAIKAGCKFYAAYPMTPASSILHFMAAQERRFNMVVKHTEDEISAINMAIGAGFAGVRAMTATSGGGFCLMTEGYGLAGMIEVPVVVINAMRPGPSTGMPTWTEQGDIKFVLSASQGDFPRIVIIPGDIEECFYLTAEAFNIAEKYQTPVIILIDKHLAESHKTTDRFGDITIERGAYASQEELKTIEKTFFKRYKLTQNGVSPRSIPGMRNGMYTASSDEHDEEGNISEEIEVRVKMMQKRMKKLDTFAKEVKQPELKGKEDAEITIISAGSTKGAIREAMIMLDDIEVNFLQIVYLSPFPSDKVKEVIDSAKKVIVIENNFTGQLADVIKEKTNRDVKRILKYDGRPFYPEEICNTVKEAVYG